MMTGQGERIAAALDALIVATIPACHSELGLGPGADREAVEAARRRFMEAVTTARGNDVPAAPERSAPCVPNLNTFSAFIDRLVIENIKVFQLQHGVLMGTPDNREERVAAVCRTVPLLVSELAQLLDNVLREGMYAHELERRTYQGV